jgi:glycosyltransferase involved in cell wall biosynthesis
MARILITSTQHPYYGGAATNAYAIIKMLRKSNHKVAGVFFTDEKVNVDPDNLGGVWRCSNNSKNKNIVRRMVKAYVGGRPEVIFGKNYVAPVIGKQMWPNAKIIYLVAGSPHMIRLSERKISANKYINSATIKPTIFLPEKNCIKASDIIIPNSKIGKDMLIKNYGLIKKIGTPLDTSTALNSAAPRYIPFNKRKYDIAFICSKLDRAVKNSELAKNIYSSKSMRRRSKIIVGKNNKIFPNMHGLSRFDLLPHKDLMKVIGDSKLVICTSFYDASPNIIKEAILCGSNILVSKNCGWSESYPKEFVCDDVYNLGEWITKSERLIKNDIKFKLPKTSSKDLMLRFDKIIENIL